MDKCPHSPPPILPHSEQFMSNSNSNSISYKGFHTNSCDSQH